MTNAFVHATYPSYLRVQNSNYDSNGAKWRNGRVSFRIFSYDPNESRFRRWRSYLICDSINFGEKAPKPHSCLLCFQIQNSSVCWSYLRYVRVSAFAKTGSFSFKKDPNLKLECPFLVNDVLNIKVQVFSWGWSETNQASIDLIPKI